MHTYILRHGRTRTNTLGLASHDPVAEVPIDAVGRRQATMMATERWTSDVASVVTSSLERTRETADLLFGMSEVDRWEDARFDEIDYGKFNGGPWTAYGNWLRAHGAGARPTGSTESWNEAMRRVLEGLAKVLYLPRPRVIIGHGFWISALLAMRDGNGWEHCADLSAPQHMCPVHFSDRELRLVIERGGARFTERPPTDADVSTGSDVRGIRGSPR